jgi:rod shape-determining protein MreD
MKAILYGVFILIIVPIQATILHHIAIGGVRPDLCLAITCLIGYVIGERHGLLLGLAVGFMQDLVSAGDMWINFLSKGVCGFVAGLVGRHLVQTTSLSFLVLVLSLSGLSSFVFLLVGRPIGEFAQDFMLQWPFLLSQAAYDSVAAVILYWLLVSVLRNRPSYKSAGTGRSRPILIMK